MCCLWILQPGVTQKNQKRSGERHVDLWLRTSESQAPGLLLGPEKTGDLWYTSALQTKADFVKKGAVAIIAPHGSSLLWLSALY